MEAGGSEAQVLPQLHNNLRSAWDLGLFIQKKKKKKIKLVILILSRGEKLVKHSYILAQQKSDKSVFSPLERPEDPEF